MKERYGELIEPPRLAFHFGAPGWDVLAALLLLALLFYIWLAIRRHNKNRYRRIALIMLTDLERRYAGRDLAYAVNMLLKAVAMMRYSRGETAAVRGAEWIGFLNRSRGRELFDSSDGNLLQELYQMGNDFPVLDSFLAKTKEWIRRSRYAL